MTTPVTTPPLPDLEAEAAEDVVAWAVAEFSPDVLLTASMADAVMIDIVHGVDPSVPVVFIDTGFHFRETYATVERVRRRYPGLELLAVGPGVGAEPIYRTGDLDGCCALNKVRPLEAVLAGKRAWFTGLRRSDSPSRADTPVVLWDASRQIVKVNPIASWRDEDVDAYIAAHDVIVNPLLFDGYASIGCEPCTKRVPPGDDPRAGRWAGTSKTECGLHI